LGTNKKF